MDISDRTASEVPLVVIPEHLVSAVDDWLWEVMRLACEAYSDTPVRRGAVVKAVHLREAFVAGSLTPAQIAEIAEGAAGWPSRQPRSAGDADDAERLVRAARELRDRARTIARKNRGGSRVVTLNAELRDVLRYQTLMVLEFAHNPFEEVRALQPAELLAVAATFRDAFAVLDVIGWLPTPQTAPVEVAITRRHFTQLKQRRADVATSILDRLDSREDLTNPDEIAEADAAIQADRRTAHALLRILRAASLEA
jgi:hypothetical protein